jgi:serine/threonine-protein phosphatase PGAM5
VLGDYIPGDPDPATLPPPFAQLVGSYSITERDEGAALARAAVEQFAGTGEEHVGPAGADAVRHELIVTHNFLIGWFIRQALDAPDWRWLGLNQQHCALTVILYRPAGPRPWSALTTQRICPGRCAGPGSRTGSAQRRTDVGLCRAAG